MNDKSQNIHDLRHSAEHVLHQAVKELYPRVQLAMGPATDDGFYFDFDGSPEGVEPVVITAANFGKIEKRMAEIIKKNLPITRHELSTKEARELFKNNPYKQEWIDKAESEGKDITVYWTGEPNKPGSMVDLCKGPHVASTGEIKAFKLLSVAGAYWHGDEKNKMLTRIYGTAFYTQEELDKYLWVQEEAKKRDHRKLGRELELFNFSDQVGQGLTLWLPNGATIRREIENYMVQEQIKMGYNHVYSPHIGQKSLWEKSGHWDLYREKMYSPMDVDGVEYLVKPMTCPMHIQSYEIHPRSYRELPYKIAEIASVYRYEQSGELSGLLRVRAFTQDDAHIFCTPDQATEQFLEVFRFIQRLYAAFGFSDYRVRLGIRSSKEKYLGNDDVWAKAEEKIVEALKESGAEYFISEGDAAFYGPKADFMIKDALGREWQCGTVQIDFMLPERFGLKYIDTNNEEQTPVMVHRAPLGSIERFVGILIEHYAGAFPMWLAPTQVSLLPISEHELDYAKSIEKSLREDGIRVNVDETASTLGKKMVKAREWKVPYMAILGKQESENKTITLKNRAGEQITLTLDECIAKLKQEIVGKV
jgi:threonyl-tRNA synthetase